MEKLKAVKTVKNEAGIIVTKEVEYRQLTSPERRQVIVPKIEVAYNTVVTSAHSQNLDHVKLVTGKNDISHKQVVVAAGENSWVKVGDHVMINVEMFPRETKPGKHDTGNVVIVHPPLEKIGNTTYLYLTDRHIKYKYIKE